MSEDTFLLKENGAESENSNTPESQRTVCNRKAVVAFFGVAIVACTIIVFSVVLSVYSGEKSPSTKVRRGTDTISFEDAFTGKYSPQGYSTNWIADDKYLAYNVQTGTMDVIDLTTNSSRPLVNPEDFRSVLGGRHWLSPDAKLILFVNNTHQQYRYSFMADYYVYNTDTRDIIPIKPPEEDSSERIAYATWNSKGYSLAYVFKNDIYYMASPTAIAHRLTTSGVKHKIFNGIPDWVYQEEILNSDNTLWFSPSDRFLCYAQFNDNDVTWYEFPWYGEQANSYTSIHKIAYPKPGYPNPTVKVKVIDLDTLTNGDEPVLKTELLPPVEFQHIDHYITTVAWGTDNMVSVTWLNRDQNRSIMQICQKTATWVCSEGSPVTVTDGWVQDTYPKPLFSTDGSYYLTVMAFPQSHKVGEFLHLAQVDLTKKPAKPTQLTAGEWEVETLLAFDDARKIVFFSSTEQSPLQRHIYSYDLNKHKKTCLTCTLPETLSGSCTYFSTQFSTKGSWYNLHCQGPDIPRYDLRSTKTNTVVVLETNEKLRDTLKDMSLPTVVKYTIKSEGYDIHVKEVRPAKFDKDKKHAVLFSVYSGPGTQKVLDTWTPLDWENGYLVTNFDLIIVTLDARGTKGRGESFKHAVYKHIGRYESLDVINVGRHLQQQSYVDKDKIAIWGWSYGGYVTSYVLGQATGVFKVGMAVAPVTDWRYYDSIYTERYMMQPRQNPDGYNISSVLPLAKNFKDESFLLVHGTGDDNVHFQNSAQLVRSLTEAEVKYRVQFYTDQAHSLSGGGANQHLYHLLEEFMVEHVDILES